ncbi:YybH family protein [Robiginitalea sp. IMCC43444]|uniref:YybH family protein n=1 Tax=Robiginitalea sp. IMCC43444 TaxID=3459121 RepID=UPI004041A829
MKTNNIYTVLCALLLVVSCGKSETDPQLEAENLMQTSRDWAQAARSGNTDSILSFWTEDAVLIMPQGPAVQGQAALREVVAFGETMPGFEVNWEPREAHVSKSGDLGYVIAHKYVKFRDTTGQQISSFHREVTIWKKQEDGSWKNVVDIYNNDPTLTSIE